MARLLLKEEKGSWKTWNGSGTTIGTGSVTEETDNRSVTSSSTINEFAEEEDVFQCLYCSTNFSTGYLLQAHLATMQHFPFEMMLTERFQIVPKGHCVVCGSDVNLWFDNEHRCTVSLAANLRRSQHGLFKYGTPLTCVLCTGAQTYSYYHLIIHLIMRHSYKGKLVSRSRNPCPLCKAPFSTDKSHVIEYHMVKEHMPEIYMQHYKDMQPEGVHSLDLKTAFHCRIPNRHYERIVRTDKARPDCTEQFSSLPKLMAHLQAFHAPIPNRALRAPLGVHSCRHCLLNFPFSSNLREHITRKHEFVNVHRANYCRSQDNLPRHLSNLTCHFCWHNFRSQFHLQAHIQASHIGCWRRCGLCQREYCKLNESRASKLVYMEIRAHEIVHVMQLQDFYKTMRRISVGDLLPYRKPPHMGEVEKYFGRINLDVAVTKRIGSDKNYTQEFKEIGERNRLAQIEFDFRD